MIPSSNITLFTALLVGLVGSIHCVGMCGGIVGVITAGLKDKASGTVFYWLSYHSGRVLSYTVAGAVVGVVGEQIYGLVSMERAHQVGVMISGLFIIALGLHVAKLWQGLAIFEKMGARLWRRVSPLVIKVLPPQALGHAFIAGIFWGWLPCGLVYSVLFLAAASGSVYYGAAVMFIFGIGTLPMLVVMATSAHWMLKFKNYEWLRKGVGVTFCLLGVIVFLGFVPWPLVTHSM